MADLWPVRVWPNSMLGGSNVIFRREPVQHLVSHTHAGVDLVHYLCNCYSSSVIKCSKTRRVCFPFCNRLFFCIYDHVHDTEVATRPQARQIDRLSFWICVCTDPCALFRSCWLQIQIIYWTHILNKLLELSAVFVGFFFVTKCIWNDQMEMVIRAWCSWVVRPTVEESISHCVGFSPISRLQWLKGKYSVAFGSWQSMSCING